MAHPICFDAFEVDLPAGQLYKQGERIRLRDKSFQVLAALLEHPGEVVSREELQRRVWTEDVFVDFDNNLNTLVATLREALGDTADHPRFIETLPKHGYRFLGKVSEAPQPQEGSPVHRARLMVLPFANFGGDSSQEYFSDAVTDEIITALAALAPEHLAVIARTTAVHYKGSHKDVARIGRELEVDYLVEGGVHRDRDQITVNVQLIHVRDQTHLFAKRFSARMDDIFNVQTSIAEAIAAHTNITALKEKTRSGSAPVRFGRKPTADLEAYDAYLKGRYHLGSWTPEGLTKAKQFFETAIARDPEFALAHDGLAEAYWWIGFLGFIRPKDAFSAGVFSALRAIEIDHTLAETHALLGMFRKELDYNWPEVHREMALALKLDSASPLVHFRYGLSGLMPVGRIDESVAELEFALESDPLSLLLHGWLGEILYLGRYYDRASEQAQLLAKLDPTYFIGYFVLGQVLCEQGSYGEAISALSKAAELSGNAPLVLGWLGMTLARSGDCGAARNVLAGLHAAATQMYILSTSFAWIHLSLGETEQAFNWMERAIEERDSIIIPIKSYPFLDPLREDPRFAVLLRKMNLEP
jgi:TolB-like protein/tetratricopeptide (TPR) repeat protein